MSLYVDELFDEIVRLPAELREAAIVERCAGWPVVEKEVRALLDVHAEGEAPTEVDLSPGAKLDRFELEELLGRGATASVWRAWDHRLQTYTALKVLDPAGGLRGQRALDAVLHEARAASSIISDHVVRIKTAGRFEHGPHYIEMELCAERRPDDLGNEVLVIGRSLAEVPLQSTEEKVRVIAEAARGVDAAHRAGVLHRDLKPGNILLTPVSRRAKVVDFGLAAEQLYPAPTPTLPSHRTITVLLEATDGKVVGTPAYMPPEQAFGHPPTRATDVYALGATLYALLIGEHPYLPRDGANVPALDVLEQVREGPPPPVRKLAKGVPRRLARILQRAMARSARDRYPTAGALADDLDAWLAGFATQVDGSAPLLRVGLFVARHRALAATLAVGLSALVVFAVAVGWLEIQRRSLSAAITHARVEQIVSSGMALLADHERLRAEAEAQAAEDARRRAVLGESNAEQRWLLEVAARQEAERLQLEAMGIRDAEIEERRVAEVRLAASTTELARTEGALARTEQLLSATEEALGRARADLQQQTKALDGLQEDLDEARAARREVEASRDAAIRARDAAEAAVRQIGVHVNDLELEVQRLRIAVEAERDARASAEARLHRLSSPRPNAIPEVAEAP